MTKKLFLEKLVLKQKMAKIDQLSKGDLASVLWRYCEDLIKEFSYNLIRLKYVADKKFLNNIKVNGIYDKILKLSFNDFEVMLKNEEQKFKTIDNTFLKFSNVKTPLNNEDILRFIFLFSNQLNAENIKGLNESSFEIYNDRNKLSHSNKRTSEPKEYDVEVIEMLEKTIWTLISYFL